MTIRCEDVASHPDFRRLATIAGLDVDLRYAGVRNFVGRDLYGALECAWLHRDAAAALERAVVQLRETAPGHRLLVLDALRPHRVQIELWNHLEGTGLRRYVADPARGSIHSFGMAIDATIVDAAGRELDMGTAFDAMTELSHPALEAHHVAIGALGREQHSHRELLRRALAAAGFRAIANEWWHFELGERERVRSSFLRVD